MANPIEVTNPLVMEWATPDDPATPNGVVTVAAGAVSFAIDYVVISSTSYDNIEKSQISDSPAYHSIELLSTLSCNFGKRRTLSGHWCKKLPKILKLRLLYRTASTCVVASIEP
jgi:hypothetical protein